MWQRAKNILPHFVFVSSAVVTCDYCHAHHTDGSSLLRRHRSSYHNNKAEYYWNLKSWIDIWSAFWFIIPVGRPVFTLAEAATITSNNSSIRPSAEPTNKKKNGNQQHKSKQPQHNNENENKNKNENNTNNSNNGKDCPFYGCQLLPLDILVAKQRLQKGKPSSRQKNYKNAILEFDTAAKQLFALRYLNNEKNQDRSSRYRNPKNEEAKIKKVMKSLSTMYSDAPNKMATMSMIGYKGGSIRDQINQDRSFVIGPFYVHNTTGTEDVDSSTTTFQEDNILLGVFDGHARFGERVSEYAVKVFPRLLSLKLGKALKKKQYSNQEDQTKEEQTQMEKEIANIVRQVMIETFVEIDKTAPAEFSGGCTASVVFKFRNKIYIANTGDSLSFIGIHRKKSNTTKIIYTSREDKPSVFEERKRIEEMGGEVFIPPPNRGGTSRVVYTDPITNSRSGLAMSRSIGDWDFSDLGVIADPTVDVLDIDQVVKSQLAESNDENEPTVDCFVFDEHGMVRPANVDTSSSDNSGNTFCQKKFEQMQKDDNNNIDGEDDDDDIHIFAISATDGMMDYATPDGIASVISQSLYNTNNDGKEKEAEQPQQLSKFSVWSSSASNEKQQKKEKDALHLLTACEMVIKYAADGWNRSKAGRYRDDIAISVSDIRSPSKSKKNQKTKGGSIKNEL